jgi:hypothetical protein
MQRKKEEIEGLFALLSSLPKANTDPTPETPTKNNDKWKHRSTSNTSVKGRVNKTRGK